MHYLLIILHPTRKTRNSGMCYNQWDTPHLLAILLFLWGQGLSLITSVCWGLRFADCYTVFFLIIWWTLKSMEPGKSQVGEKKPKTGKSIPTFLQSILSVYKPYSQIVKLFPQFNKSRPQINKLYPWISNPCAQICKLYVWFFNPYPQIHNPCIHFLLYVPPVLQTVLTDWQTDRPWLIYL